MTQIQWHIQGVLGVMEHPPKPQRYSLCKELPSQISKLISTTIQSIASNHYLETKTLSLALQSLASSSIATHQHVLKPLEPQSQVKVSSILNNAHLETGVAENFSHALRAQIVKHPPM